MWINRTEYNNLKNATDNHSILIEKVKTDAAIDRYDLQSKFNECEKNLNTANKKIRKLKEVVREQTSADLLVVGLKAVGIISEKKKEDYVEQQRVLQQRQALANYCGQPQNLYTNTLQNMFGALGGAKLW